MSPKAAVSSCGVSTCAFNSEGCQAFAVTIDGGAKPSCVTFVSLDVRGGLGGGQVGACKRLECKYNSQLTCTAQSVAIADDQSCASFELK